MSRARVSGLIDSGLRSRPATHRLSTAARLFWLIVAGYFVAGRLNAFLGRIVAAQPHPGYVA